jgi:putative peptidoglycan lipid II flippase
MFPFLLLVALAAQAMGILNSCNQFAVPAFSSTWFNVGSVVFGLGLGFLAGPTLGITPIEGMAYGVVMGGALQLIWQIPSLQRQGFRFRPAFDFNHPGLRHIFKLMVPAIIGNASVQVNVLVNTFFATSINDPVRGVDGPTGWLQYAFRFMQLPLGLFGVAIATATLPAIGRSAASGDVDEFRETLARSLGLVFLLTVPAAAGLVVLGPSIIGAIYEGREFAAYDTRQTAMALSYYSIGLAGYAAVKVLTPAFYALKDSQTPMVVSLASIGINGGAAWFLVRHTKMGHAGMALSTSCVALFSFVTLFLVIRQKLGGIHGRRLRSVVAKVSVASLLMTSVVWVSSKVIGYGLGQGFVGRMTDLAVSIPLGMGVLYWAARSMKIEELEMATRALGGPLMRRFSRAK